MSNYSGGEMDDCVFCKIVRGDFGTQLIAENGSAIAFDDIHPLAPIHVLLVPRDHVASVHDAPGIDPAVLADCLRLASTVAESKGIAERGYRVVTNVGPDAGQSVFHLHFHLLGGRRLGTGV